MRKSDTLLKFILLTASVVLLTGSSSWAVKSWQQFTTTAITGVAFYDCNGNSVRDNNEAPFPNMTATLCGRTTAGDSITLVTTTDSLGHYTFVGLAEGKFNVKFSFPNGTSALSFTTKSAAIDGSDVNSDGTTDFFLVDGLRDVEGIDVGIIDNIAPIVSFTNSFLTPYTNGDTITVECDNLPTMNATWATAQDNSGQPVSVQFFDFAISTNDCKRTGYMTILHCIWRSTDVCGNSGEKAVFIKIKDSKPPVLSGIPADIIVNTVRGERVPAVATGILARDNCSQNLDPATFQETQTLNTCGKIITRTWSVSDDCGNVALGSQHITVISDAACSGLASDTLRFTLSVNGVLDTCLNLPIGSNISNIQHCSSGQQGATILLTASNCLKVTPSVNFVGRDTFCARVCDVNGQNCHDMLLFLTIQGARFSSCELLSGMNTINLMPTVCGQNACYCIIGTTDIRTLQNDYTLTDNGLPYTGGLTGCQFDTVFSYNYFAVSDMGTTGPYRLDTWQVNGTTRQIATFQTIQELADSMNLWDPMGNWRIDPVHFTIYGGDMRNQYGQMHITHLANSAFATLTLNTGLISNGVKVCFTTGVHTLIFQNNVTGCADTLRANVFCQNERIAPIALNDRVSTAKNTPLRIAAIVNDTLNGIFDNIVALNQPSHGSLGFQNLQTFLYTPTTNYCGQDTFDYRVCNAFGLCDTASIFIDVTCNTDTTGNNGRRSIALDDVATTRMNTPITLSVLDNDTLNGALIHPLSIIRFQTHGSANIINNQIIYTPTNGFCNGLDSFDYEICNANGCDTGRVVVTVTCESDTTGGGGTRKPVAVDDVATTRLNTPVTLSPLANDTLNGALSTPLSILRLQTHGATSIQNNQIIYTPTLGYCGGSDTLDYVICNANGCDTARIIVNITCENDGSGRPIAVDDRTTTRLDSRITIPVLANDILNGFLRRAINIISSPNYGTAFVTNNQIVYMPDATFCGDNDTLNYEICNAIGCDTASVIIAITCNTDTTNGNTNRKPIALDDTASTRLNTSVTLLPLANDSLNGVLTRPLSIIGAANHGLSFIMSNQIIYTPEATFCGAHDTLTYEICNTFGCDTGQIIVAVSCDNGRPKPIAIDDVASTFVNTPVTIAVLTNDTINGSLNAPLSIVYFQTHGVASVSNNQIIYTPSAGYCNNKDTLDYQICNANGCDTARLIISIFCDTTTNGGGSNRPIAAVNDNILTPKNTGITFRPTLNDTIRTKLLSLMILNAPRNGTIAFKGLDTLLYTPNPEFCGRDTFQYTICDTSFICTNAFVFINVTCDSTVNGDMRKPTAFNDFATTQKGHPITIAVLANDSTFGALTRPITVIRTPRNGTTSIQNNQIVYTPNPTFCDGQDTLTYEVCNANGCDTADIYVAVTCDTTTNTGGSNRPVVAVNDTISTRKNVQLTFKPTLNDTVRTRLLALMILNAPRHGTISFTGLDTLLYAPNQDYCGSDTLEYSICDTSFNCSNAFIYVNVTCDSTSNGLLLPIAVPDYALTRKLTPIRIPILANDTLNGVLDSISIIRLPQRGVATLGNDKVLTYSTDTCGFIDTVIYRICNRNGCDTALVAITVRCQNDTTNSGLLVPIALNDAAQTGVNQAIVVNVLQNDTLNGVLRRPLSITGRPRFGTALVNGNNQIVYTPQAGFCGGKDTLVYEICNTNGCVTAIVSITVVCDSLTATRQPIAVPDYATTPKNTPINMPILANDTLNGTLDSIKIIRSPFFGIASLDSNNILTYTPDSCGFTDSLIYRICNRNGCDTAIVRIKVICDTVIINTLAPVAIFDTARTAKGQTITIRVTLNDTLRGADTFRITRRPIHGLAMFDTLYQIAYIPEALYCGKDTLIYEICNRNGCDTALVTITVTCDIVPPVLRPVAVDDYVRTIINRQVDFTLLNNDILRGARSAEMVSPPKHGTIIIMPDSLAMYKPDHEFCGLDSFMYQLCNVTGCDTAIVRIEVSCGDSLHVFSGFSPNGDNKNDALVIRGIENYPDNEVMIFNRWGIQVFSQKGYRNDNGWDGSWGEKYVPDGTYFYFIRLNDGKNQQFSGYVQLVR